MNFMNIALEAAIKGKKLGNVPVGCVIVKNDKVISVKYNLKNTENISVYHAEILAIIDACKKSNSWYLDDCEMYVTLKPCEMCTAAIAESRIKKVYYLLDTYYGDNLNKNINNIEFYKLNDERYNNLISSFFDELRK